MSYPTSAVSAIKQPTETVLSQIDLFFSLANNLSSEEIVAARKPLGNLLNNGFTVDPDNLVAGINQSWPVLKKDFVYVSGIATFRRGGFGFGTTTLSQYIDRLTVFSLDKTRSVDAIQQSTFSDPVPIPSSASNQKPMPQVKKTTPSDQIVSTQDFLASLLSGLAANGGSVVISEPASFLVPQTTPLAIDSDQVAALARFQPGDMYYEDSTGKIAIVKGFGPDKGKIVAIDIGMKQYPAYSGIQGFYDHGDHIYSDAPVDASIAMTLDEKTIRQLAEKLMAIPVKK